MYEQMQANFIVDELRDYDDIVRLFGHNYYILHIMLDKTKVEIMGLWQVGDYKYLEHVVIYEQFRNNGIARQALELLA